MGMGLTADGATSASKAAMPCRQGARNTVRYRTIRGGRDRISQAPIGTIPRRSNGGRREPLISTRGLVAAFAAIALTTSPALASMPVSPSASSTLTHHSIGIDGGQHLLSRSWSDGRADGALAAWLSVVVANVRQVDAAARRPLPSGRTRLSRLWPKRRPSPDKFAYTFDHIGEIVVRFADTLELKHCVLYIQDYGGPIGFRLALAHPDRIKGIIVQNAVASEDGLGSAWDIRKAYWKDRASYEGKVMPGFHFAGGRQDPPCRLQSAPRAL